MPSPPSRAFNSFRLVLVVAVAGLVGALAVGLAVRANRWEAQPILSVIRSDRIRGRTLEVQIESCLQGDRARIVDQDDASIVLRAESKGSPGGDCTDGLATVCAEDAIDGRMIVDESTGEAVALRVESLPNLPDCG
jgi:hypothetical protein